MWLGLADLRTLTKICVYVYMYTHKQIHQYVSMNICNIHIYVYMHIYIWLIILDDPQQIPNIDQPSVLQRILQQTAAVAMSLTRRRQKSVSVTTSWSLGLRQIEGSRALITEARRLEHDYLQAPKPRHEQLPASISSVHVLAFGKPGLGYACRNPG